MTTRPIIEPDADLRGEFDTVAHTIESHPEVAFTEVVAHGALTSWLSDHGFTIDPVRDLPTAFLARSGVGSPTLAILLEYDALPGIGHGCGHQLIAAGGAMAAIHAARRLPGSGTIVAVGCPAEESGAGKAHLLDSGAFADVDAAMMFHPASRTLLARSSLAATAVTVEFHGIGAHAAKAPEHGRNALTSMTTLFVAIDAFRARMGRWGRINGIITDGGRATNVIPDYTRAEFMVRGATRVDVLELVAELRELATGAAAIAGTSATVAVDGPPYAERRNNRTLLRALARHMEYANLEIDQPDVDENVGSSDVGNVSLVVPTIHPTVRITEHAVPSHTSDFAEVARQPLARDRTASMAQALAGLAIQIMADPDLLDQARAEFEQGGFDAPGTDFSDLSNATPGPASQIDLLHGR